MVCSFRSDNNDLKNASRSSQSKNKPYYGIALHPQIVIKSIIIFDLKKKYNFLLMKMAINQNVLMLHVNAGK